MTLLIIFNVPLYQTVGTTMLVILPIAAFGSLGFLAAGHLDLVLFLQVLAGQVIGAYVGAKFTRMAPQLLLKGCHGGAAGAGRSDSAARPLKSPRRNPTEAQCLWRSAPPIRRADAGH